MKEELQYPNTLARLLIETKANHRLSAVEMAAHIGCHRSLLYRWMKGECLPQKRKYLQGIARLCGQKMAFINKIVLAATSRTLYFPRSLRQPLFETQGSVDPFDSFSALVEDVFQADQVELFLAGIATPLPYLWNVNVYLPDSPPMSSSCIPLYEYVKDWSGFDPKNQNDLIVRSFVTQQIQELFDARYLQQLGIAGTWFLAIPLLYRERSLGCLVLKSSTRAYLNLAETKLLKDVCRCMAEGIVQHSRVLDRMGIYHAARTLLNTYKGIEGNELLERPAYLAALAEQASALGRLLLSVSSQLRDTHFRFHDISIQYIDEQSGVMLAIGTQHGKSLQPPALFDSTTAMSCWESFKSNKLVYRPDLLKEDPYNERDLFSSRPVLAILDIPFGWGKHQGTIGVNSLEPHSWGDRDLDFIWDFVRRFDLSQG